MTTKTFMILHDNPTTVSPMTTDSACRSRVSKVGVAVGVPVAVLVLVTAIFTIFLLRSRRQKEQYRDKLRSRSELYGGDDGDWEGSQGFAAGNLAATWEDMETPSTSYINLERVDTSRTVGGTSPGP
ncbi:hypothetical protein DUI87_00290 [Hirundo rustica rustica]|uniref:Uncharacterized protein n=1 Tax=Hirundo rustica rustica TaxID=333673 RepID=A0A3M0LUM1_HIRRU|nr:hypothetical protein DUI87_00290 [Hirundo rustica rustica]